MMCKNNFLRNGNKCWDRSTLKSWILEADRRIRYLPSQPRPAAPTFPPPTSPPTSSHDRLFLYFVTTTNMIFPSSFKTSIASLSSLPVLEYAN